MRITSLELVGFKRMMLNNVESFTIKPTEPAQLILGTNGSGKSSLIGEMTPLPANPADYFKEGSKTIRITHRGSNYVLGSTFSPKPEHSFLKNDEEQNPGGTISVQKELVRKEFLVTNEIHELLIGREVFCSMSPSRRREWFTQLSDISYDYALGVYQKLKERSRDTSGALKLARKRLVSESTKVISADEEKRLTNEIFQTSNELNLLQSQRAPVERPVEAYENDLRGGLEELTRMSTRLLRMRFVAPYGHNPHQQEYRNDWYELVRPGFQSIKDIDTVIDEFRQEITVKEALINKAVSEHSKIKDTVKILLKRGEDGITALTLKLNTLREDRNAILRSRKLGLEGIDAVNAASALDTVYESLIAIFAEMPANENKRYSSVKLSDTKQFLLAARDLRSKKASEIAYLSSQKAHMDVHKNAGETKCPKCNHSWVQGHSDQAYEKLLELIGQQEVLLANQDQAITALEVEIAAIEEYAELYREFIRCVRNWPVLQVFWDYLMEGGYVTNSPRQAVTVLEQFKQDLVLELDAKRINDDLIEIGELIKSSEQVGDANLTEMNLKLGEVTLTIEELTSGLTKAQNSLADYTHYRRQLLEAEDLAGKIEGLKTSLEKTNTDMIEMIRRETLNHCIRQLQHSLVRKEETLSAITLQKGIIADLEKSIEKLAVEDEAARALVKELSPTDGLIAEGLLGFIRNFTGQMNALIRKIWSYPLQIQDCGVSGVAGAELDYRFPMMVQLKSNIVPDVSKGSSGMQEIVNLAFKVVAMRYLGLAESPLYLDEFGASFDEAHRSSAMLTVKTLMDQQPFTQLFMVSHYESNYGAMTNAEICVICPTNITIPTEQKYNQHVIIS